MPRYFGLFRRPRETRGRIIFILIFSNTFLALFACNFAFAIAFLSSKLPLGLADTLVILWYLLFGLWVQRPMSTWYLNAATLMGIAAINIAATLWGTFSPTPLRDSYTLFTGGLGSPHASLFVNILIAFIPSLIFWLAAEYKAWLSHRRLGPRPNRDRNHKTM